MHYLALFINTRSRLNNVWTNKSSHQGSLHFVYPFRSKQYNEANLKKALKLQKSMSAHMGCTEIFKPLENVFKNKPSASYSRQVSIPNVFQYFLTGMFMQMPHIKY